MKRLWFLIICALMSTLGCALIEGPREKLTHAAFSFNEGLRWGRYNDVLPAVDPEFLEHFVEFHKEWGHDVQISSVEITASTYDDTQHAAELQVVFSWYRKSEMLMKTTVTSQHWEYRDGAWWLIAEAYVSGDAF